jgi:uncharacterized OB-fold protein
LTRIPPAPDNTSKPFWQAGAYGELRVQRCSSCLVYHHPPGVRCANCGSRKLAFEAVSGHGTIYSFVVNHQQWHPSYPTPYVIASVELLEQPGLRLITNIVDCDLDDVVIGMPVSVVFEPLGAYFVPLFTPEARP